LRSLLALLVLLLPACQAPSRTLEIRLQHLPPTAKDVIAAALEASSLPLSDASCQTAGTQSSDRNIARYLAGFLSEFSRPQDSNSIEAACEDGKDGTLRCRLWLRHAAGEDVWSWGLEFQARKSDGLVEPSSLRCLGAG
jgi:hypothetical protein